MKNNKDNFIDNDRSFKEIKKNKIPIADVNKYIEFVNFYNEFINHRPKKFKQIKGEFVF